MYRVIINQTPLFFQTYEETKDYLKKYLDFDYDSDCNMWSGKGSYIIKIEQFEFYTKTDRLAWDPSIPMWEVFEDHEVLEKEYNKYIDVIRDKEDYVDSYRIGLKDSPESMKHYEELISCCGSNDTEVEINGKVYVFGCNFGH